ncbi:hypothetical protein LGK97_16575 [Clostridium sp. CS001]|uniref:hypothetical protein n=1 Tax=Clostridium sp. CS001 TaxID=2880648 RepID=UPI001CF5928B|nr:hypothetical protein [Clostridium sp. CS001]MCB2291343.1 hypothetical protein [Clostridium sp. CS001]
MNNLLSEIIEIEFALSKIKFSDLYNGGIELFKAMNYPVNPANVAINLDVNQFIYFKVDNKTQFGADEHDYLKKIESISLLFTIVPEDIVCKKLKRRKNDFEKIVFLAVDLNCNKNERSHDAHWITKILSKAYSDPVFILFYHEECILFSALQYEIIGEGQSAKVFLSDWYNCTEMEYETICRLSELCFENQAINNIGELFHEMIISISRNYYTYIEAYESMIFEDSMIAKNNEEVFNSDERVYSYKLYGDDYVNEGETIEILLPEDDEWLLNELDWETPYDEEIDEEYMENELYKKDNYVEEDEYTLPKDINEGCFEDPIKMLEWLNVEEKDESTESFFNFTKTLAIESKPKYELKFHKSNLEYETNKEWKKNYLNFQLHEIETWTIEESILWLDQTAKLPLNLKDDIVNIYQEYKIVVKGRVSDLKIENIIMIFEELDENAKRKCLNILNENNNDIENNKEVTNATLIPDISKSRKKEKPKQIIKSKLISIFNETLTYVKLLYSDEEKIKIKNYLAHVQTNLYMAGYDVTEIKMQEIFMMFFTELNFDLVEGSYEEDFVAVKDMNGNIIVREYISLRG